MHPKRTKKASKQIIIVQGRKVLCFKRDGLVKMHKALQAVNRMNEFGHFDLWASRALGMHQIYYPSKPMFGVRAHSSATSSKDGKPVRIKRRCVD